jgi:putative nucleotidyltransferase with HDIG domain
MMDTLTKLVDTDIIFIMVPDDKGYYRITQAKRVSENNIKFSNNHPVIRTLKTKKTPLVRNNIEDTELLRYFEQCNVNIFVPVIYKDELLSIIGIGDKQYGEYHDDDLLRLYSFSVNAALGMINTNLYEERTKHLYKGIKVLAKALEIKDTYTYGHCERVAEIAVKIGVELGLSDSQLEDIRISAILHDIGKIGVSRQILNKPRFLSPQEFQEIKKHPEIGIRIVESIPFSRDVLHGVKLHHERFDGNGYPEGREKTESPLIARIIQVADAYEAMTSDRPYRKAMKKEDALREIKIGKGTQFDPEIVDVFLKIIENEEL